jgi:hypothetical protein
MVPLLPTATQADALVQVMPSGLMGGEESCLVQVIPALVVARIPWPVAKQVLGVGQLMALKPTVVLEVWLTQVAPPLIVARMVPPAPTAKQALVSGQLMPFKVGAEKLGAEGVDENWCVQVIPLLTVATMVSPSPAAKQVLVIGQLAPSSRSKVLPATLDCRLVQLEPALKVVTMAPRDPTAWHVPGLTALGQLTPFNGWPSVWGGSGIGIQLNPLLKVTNTSFTAFADDTAMQKEVFGQLTPDSATKDCTIATFHVPPPNTVQIACPALSTATQFAALAQLMAVREPDGSKTDWLVQWLPPVVVTRNMFGGAATKHVFMPGQLMPARLFIVPEVWGNQEVPLRVARIVPPDPTAKQFVVPRQLTPVKPTEVPEN